MSTSKPSVALHREVNRAKLAERIPALIAQGRNAPAIAKILRVDRKTVRRYMDLTGLRAPPADQLTPAVEAAILAEYAAEVPLAQIAGAAGMSKERLQRHIDRAIADGRIAQRRFLPRNPSKAPQSRNAHPGPPPVVEAAEDTEACRYIASLQARANLSREAAAHSARLAREKAELRRPGAFWTGPPPPPRQPRATAPYRIGQGGSG